MKTIRLVAMCDEYDATPGFVIKGTPAFEGLMADRGGLSIAHDLLEHQNGTKNMGPVWDELEALGGIWYVRGQHGDLMTPSVWSPHHNIASDVERMFMQWTGEDAAYWGPGGYKAGSRPCDYDDDFIEIVSEARTMIQREQREELADGESGLSELLEQYLTLALHRMRHGFRKAHKRFEKHGRYHANSLFRAVKDAVKQAAKHIEYEGQEYILRYGNGDATVREVYDRDEY